MLYGKVTNSFDSMKMLDEFFSTIELYNYTFPKKNKWYEFH